MQVSADRNDEGQVFYSHNMLVAKMNYIWTFVHIHETILLFKIKPEKALNLKIINEVKLKQKNSSVRYLTQVK